MIDLKVLNAVIDQLQEERGIPRDKMIDAIEQALATAYKKEYGKKGQIVRAHFNPDTAEVEFEQIKIVVDESRLKNPENDEEGETSETKDKGGDKDEDADSDIKKVYFNPEHHIMLEDAKKIKADAQVDDEIAFPLEEKDEYGRISAQTAKQVIIQKIREAEKVSVSEEFSEKEGEVVTGSVQRIERGNIFVDLGRTTGILPYEEQIPGERYRQGERIRAYLQRVDETSRGIFLRLSRSHPDFLKKLFENESPEVASGTVEIKSVAREAGSRSKVAVVGYDEHIDPVGSLVGQRGVRVSTVMSELGGEKIDIIEWSDNQSLFIEEALSPAKIVEVGIDEESKEATVIVTEDQQSLAIGKGGQNVRLAAKLTGWKIDIRPYQDENAEEEEVEEEDDDNNNNDVGALDTATGTQDEPSSNSDESTNEQVGEEKPDLQNETEKSEDSSNPKENMSETKEEDSVLEEEKQGETTEGDGEQKNGDDNQEDDLETKDDEKDNN